MSTRQVEKWTDSLSRSLFVSLSHLNCANSRYCGGDKVIPPNLECAYEFWMLVRPRSSLDRIELSTIYARLPLCLTLCHVCRSPSLKKYMCWSSAGDRESCSHEGRQNEWTHKWPAHLSEVYPIDKMNANRSMLDMYLIIVSTAFLVQVNLSLMQQMMQDKRSFLMGEFSVFLWTALNLHLTNSNLILCAVRASKQRPPQNWTVILDLTITSARVTAKTIKQQTNQLVATLKRNKTRGSSGFSQNLRFSLKNITEKSTILEKTLTTRSYLFGTRLVTLRFECVNSARTKLSSALNVLLSVILTKQRTGRNFINPFGLVNVLITECNKNYDFPVTGLANAQTISIPG